MHSYRAPWGKTLRWFSGLAVLVLVAAALLQPARGRPVAQVAALVPLIVLVLAPLFAVRGYEIDPDGLVIRRLLWKTRLRSGPLQSAEFVPRVMSRSLRLFGNGGLFSFTGLYQNRLLGRYRAFVTDLNLTVVLRYARRTIVISPEDPAHFVRELRGQSQ